MYKDYEPWIGKRVILHLLSGGLQVPLRCKVIGESDGRVRIRVGDGWDVDMYKEMIQNVEKDSAVLALTEEKLAEMFKARAR